MRPWHTWLIFGLCLTVVLAAMGWLTVVVLHLDRSEAAAIHHAVVEERARLALWRMDSALAPLVAQESTRPYFAYNSFSPTERAYNRKLNDVEPNDILVASPLLDSATPHVLVHFQIAPDGTLSSPQVPTGLIRQLAESKYTTAERIDVHAGRLAQLERLLDRRMLTASLAPPQTQPRELRGECIIRVIPLETPRMLKSSIRD